MLPPPALVLHGAKLCYGKSLVLSPPRVSGPSVPLLSLAWIEGLLGLRFAKYLQSVYYFLLMLPG